MSILHTFLMPSRYFKMVCLLIATAAISSGLQNKEIAPQFKTQILDDKIQIGYGLAIGDVDGDGKEDILLADKQQFVWYRNGIGSGLLWLKI